MSKVTQSISIDLDDLELLSEIKSRYHLKNLSQAIHTLIKQWQMMVDERARMQLAVKEVKKQSNPMVDL